MPYPPKVEAQRGYTEGLQCLCHFEDHFVMHGAATQRMWMADDCNVFRNYTLFFWLKNPLQVANWSRYIDVQYLTDDAPFLSFLKPRGKL